MANGILTRRGMLGGGLALAAGLVVPPAAEQALVYVGHSAVCGAPYGPLHQFLFQTAPDPWWQDRIIWRESRWDASAYNPSGAAGLAQFMPRTWAWGSRRFGVYGSPYDPYAAIRMMNAFVAAGEYYHWSETDW